MYLAASDYRPVYTGDSDPDRLRFHGGKLDSNPDSDHPSHIDCDPDSNLDSGPGSRVNVAYGMSCKFKGNYM